MKLAVLSESEVDEAALRIIAEAIVGQAVDWHQGLQRRSGGFGSVPKLLPPLLKHLHYQTDVDGLLLVVDSDLTPLHLPEHHPDYQHPQCRFCNLQRIADDVTLHLRPRATGTSVRTAIGLAVPQIEAWYLFGVEPKATEANWLALDPGAQHKYKNSLKLSAYGVDRAPIALMKSKAIEHATRLVADLASLEAFFQNGFRPFSATIRTWSERKL